MSLTDKFLFEKESSDGATVLVVDDTPANLKVVENCLKGRGYTTLVARNGETALKRISYTRPDLILLDVMMPGIDGFEICQQLKNDDHTKDIPVIFMTALSEPEHKIKGFSVGAVDYITKPVQKQELLARVDTHLKIYRYQDHLEKEVKKRTEMLEERMVALDKEVVSRREAEKDLRHLRNYLYNIINSMPSVLVCVDKKGEVTEWNKQAETYTGIDALAAIGQKLPDVLPHMSADMKKISQSISSREIKREVKRHSATESELRYDDVIIYPLIVNGVEGAVIRIDDVTEKVRMEEMMIQSEKMLSVGGLAAGMAHEINNPLAGIVQNADVMSKRLTDTKMPANTRITDDMGISMDVIKEFMERRGVVRMLTAITDSGHRIAEIVANMLNFARKSDSIVSTYDLSQILNSTLKIASIDYDLKKQYDFKTVRIVKEYAKDLPLITCEAAKIQQVLLNILRNGAQAMQGAKTENPRLIIRTYFEKSEKRVVIEIEDNGPGMNDAVRKRIFEPFFTTKPVGLGTGLGLSVSYFIITENHGGDLEVSSNPGKGTRFIIRLPLEKKA